MNSMPVVTRSYDIARTGVNTNETALTPRRVGDGFLTKYFSLTFDDDPRLEAQPLYVPGIKMNDGNVHDVVYVCTMANNIWAFDANDGTRIWQQPANLGRPIQPKARPHKGFANATEIDRWGINILWGILSTPVIDLDTNRMYVVNWSSSDGSVDNSSFELHAIDITSGQDVSSPLAVAASAPSQQAPGKAVPTFIPNRQKQRASLLLLTPANCAIARKTLFLACGMLHENNDPTHGWLIAYDVDTFRQTAAWCTTPNGTGSGIWQAGAGPSADENGDIYVMTGNYGVRDAAGHAVAPAAGDLAESIVKLHYTPPTDDASPGKLEAVAWFTPFQDSMRSTNGVHDFQDYDLGSGGPVPIPGMSIVVGAGKDGVLYVLDKDTAKFGQGSDFSKLKQPPVFFTYNPGPGIDASVLANLDKFYDRKTHHLHGTPIYWNSPTGPMLCVWGENESLRAYSLDPSGKVTLRAKSLAIASPYSPGIGGMPGGFPVISCNGSKPNTGIIWATAPRFGDAYKHLVEGILRAYDATKPDQVKNSDGSARLHLLWKSTQIPNNTFTHSKFCPPVVADGKVFVPTYDGRVDVYGLEETPVGPLPTNAEEMPDA
jgi:outer membrane protein assembly factor BamB